MHRRSNLACHAARSKDPPGAVIPGATVKARNIGPDLFSGFRVVIFPKLRQSAALGSCEANGILLYPSPSQRSISSSRLYFARRSEPRTEPTLICPAPE